MLRPASSTHGRQEGRKAGVSGAAGREVLRTFPNLALWARDSLMNKKRTLTGQT